VTIPLIAPCGVVCEHRDEGSGKCPTRDDREEQIRELEGSVVRIELRSDAERGRDHRVAEQPCCSGQTERGRHDQYVARDVPAGI